MALREAREERGLSQEYAALAGSIDRSYWGHIERSSKSPTIGTVWRVASAVGVRPSQLFMRAERILDEGKRSR